MLPKELSDYLQGEIQRITRDQNREGQRTQRYLEEQEKKRQLDQQAEEMFLRLWGRLNLLSYLKAIKKTFGGGIFEVEDSLKPVDQQDKPYCISSRSETHSRIEWPWFYLPTFPSSVNVGIWVWREISLTNLPLPAGVKDMESLPDSRDYLMRAAQISVMLITGSHYPSQRVTAGVEITGGRFLNPYRRNNPQVLKDFPPTYGGLLNPLDSSFERKMGRELQQALKHRTYSWIDHYDAGGGSKS